MKVTVFLLALFCALSLGSAGYLLYDNNIMRTSLEERQRIAEEKQRIAQEKQLLLKEKEEQLARTTKAHDQLVFKLKKEIRNQQIQIK